MEYASKSLITIGRPRSASRAAIRLAIVLVVLFAALYFVPWQQSIAGRGQVTVYDAMSRPQGVNAQIPGRLVAWRVQEGDEVRKGQVIAVLEDIDAKFLDPRQVRRVEEGRELAKKTQEESEGRISELTGQRQLLGVAQRNAIAAARQAIYQSGQRRRALDKILEQARRQLQIRREVAAQSATERVNQAKDRIVQAEQALVGAKQQEVTMLQRRDRIAYLKSEGLRSGQDLEFAENDYVKSKTEVERAEKAVEIAKRDLTVGNLAENQATIEIQAGEAAVAKAEADLAVADRDIVNARLNLNRVMGETQAQISRVSADVQSARESWAKYAGEVQKAEIELSNLQIRTGQQVVRAPIEGRVARVLQVGAGATVNAGDQLAVVVPTTSDRIVELYVTGNDVALLDVGRPVRVQFAGWPALQFSGFPSVAVGTFGGRVKVIDPVDDGTARYRVLVEQAVHLLPGGRMDEPWPGSDRLRPGAESMGWIMLDTVPLGFELWRQFNGFPPRIDPKNAPGSENAAKNSALGSIKIKAK